MVCEDLKELAARSVEHVDRALSRHGRADRIAQASLAIAKPDFAHVYQKGVAGDAELTREELTQWMMFCRAVFLSGEDFFLQHNAGQISERAFDAYLAGLKYFVSMPGVRVAWKVPEDQFGDDFRSFANGIIATMPPRVTDAYADWRELLESDAG